MNSPAPQTERLARRLAVAVLVLIVITLGSLAYARIAADRAAKASEQAKATVACVNHLLGTRAPSTEADSKAHITLAQEQQRFDDALAAVLNAPKAKQAAEYVAFLAELNRDVSITSTAVKVLADDQHFRDTHQLGHC